MDFVIQKDRNIKVSGISSSFDQIKQNIPVFGFDQWGVFTSTLLGEIQDQSKEPGVLECSLAARQWRCWCCLQLSSVGPALSPVTGLCLCLVSPLPGLATAKVAQG